MLNVIKELKDDTLTVRLVGTLDERADLDVSLGKLPARVVVQCRDLTRINSNGTRTWVKYFHQASADGVRFCFQECSPIVVQQLNLVSNFIPVQSEIESVCAPYLCSSCKTQFTGVLKPEELRKMNFKLPVISCPKCAQKTAEFDDIESAYFQFLLEAATGSR